PDLGCLRRLGVDAGIIADTRWRAGRGCPVCREAGYKGRIAIHELLVMDDAIRSLVVGRASDGDIREACRKNGMRTLLEDGVVKASRGLTTLEELTRVVPPETSRRVDGRDAPATDATVPPSSDVPRGRVLVVEDSPTISTVVKYFLE